MQEQNKGSFFDPKTIMAVVLVGAVWFGWQTYLTKKYPNYNKPKTAETTPVVTAPGAAGTTAVAGTPGSAIETKNTPTSQTPDKEYQYQDQNITFTVSN